MSANARGEGPSDPPTLLVAGGTRVDAGKTTFSTGLLATLARRTGDAVGVKPRAGNDYWFDHDDFRIAAGSGRLYGKDARKLAAASTRPLDASGDASDDDPATARGAVTPESINPLHRLWRPTPGRTGMLGESDRTFLCDRITSPAVADGVGSRFVLNGAAADAGLVPEALRDHLPLSDAVRVDDVSELDEVTAETYLPAFEALADRVDAATVPVVVESYGDVAAPLSAEYDAVAVVEPGRARIYAGDRYRKARAVASGSPREGSLEEHTERMTEMIDPLSTTRLPALSGEERGDPTLVADRYEPAYGALLDAVSV
ncbi:Predicted P-loop ATPase/GTPase [Halorubrum aquaticum]|uniref:Predicted P-loop ATPase/GTPase n=1 Tax=Halorubrum aquaticum TaxID=387340 RepID=A0A1I3BLE5_9EURY|nr:ATPase [Halorubrum aquaticum]SFH62936.1 Predicted P-loop ATPase/GTPase [Halorubrum aquaticum]